MVYAAGFAALGTKQSSNKPVPLYFKQFGVETLDGDEAIEEARLTAQIKAQTVFEEAIALYSFEKECSKVPGSSTQTNRTTVQGLCKLQDLFAAPKTLLYAANGSLIAILVCDAEENLGMARLQLSAMMDFVMSKSKGLDADPFQLAGQLDVLEAYILQHFPSGLLIFENTRVAAQLTKQATTSLKT
eukprot:TRINITY_DN12053_c0_g2_i1.p1 TRINITY_DN12053_c0_g2~~TRINITY_DN12053_c0_g2_i1.p1  ORF type:complete len:187 (+),score=59.28 TRINITY_DN12053_c0_g2_i1:394-954(+)